MFIYSHKEEGISLGAWFSGFILLLACIGQLYLQFSYSIDFPFSDEWDYFNSYKIPIHFDLSWLFRRYNSHYVISEHLLLWLHYKINALDFKIHQLTNFIFFNLFVFSFFKVSQKLYIKKTPIIISLIFLYSCVAWEIHVWANCSSCYLFYLYGLWAIYFSTLPSISFKESAFSSCLGILSVLSFSGGLVFGLVVIIGATLNLFIFQKVHKTLKKAAFIYVPYLFLIFIIFYYIISYEHCTKFAPPIRLEQAYNFMLFFLALMSGGFGIDWDLSDPRLPIILGALYVFVIGFGVVFLFKSKNVPLQNKQFILLSLMAGIGIPLLVTYGRANGGILQALTSRYRIFSLASFPLVFMLFSQNCFSKDLKRLCFGIFLLINLLNWRVHTNSFYYKDWYQLRKQAEECLIKAYKESDANRFCQVFHHTQKPMLDFLILAQSMGVNFTKKPPLQPCNNSSVNLKQITK